MKITVGLPLKTNFILPDYSSSDGWIVSGKLGDGSTTHELAADLFSGDGTTWSLSLPVGTTATYAAGDYTLYLLATKSAETELAREESVKVVSLGAISHARKMVTALERLMEGASTKDYISLSTPEGESITRLTPEERIKWLNHYRKQLSAEHTAAAGGCRVKRIQMGFSR